VSEELPPSWATGVRGRFDGRDLAPLFARVAREREEATASNRTAGREIDGVYPPVGQVLEAFRRTPLEEVRAVILGQDPYHGPGQAHGLAFSTLCDTWPPSLRNIIRELCEDCGFERPSSGSLMPWAEHGVLLLNTVLTVRRSGGADSHLPIGWQALTNAAIGAVAAKPEPIVFMLWGKRAQAMGASIDRNRHVVVERSHPSPMSAQLNFLGTRPFGCANAALHARNAPPICWSLG
jgi:uracil-DNA glycosylase